MATTLTAEQVGRLLTRFDQAKADRSNMESQWQSLSRVLFPQEGQFTEAPYTPGEPINRKIYNGVGIHSNELLASGFFSLLTSPSAPWFTIESSDPMVNQDFYSKAWMMDVARITASEIQRPQTMFTTAMHEGYLEYGAYGNTTIFVTERADRSSLLFNALALAECFFIENEEGRVTTLMRRYRRSALQLRDKFGEQNLSKEVLNALNSNNAEARFDVLHVIMPNSDANALRMGNTYLPYASIYIDVANKHVMQHSGYEEQPFMSARFYKLPNEVYGRGPGSTALADLNMVQQIMKTIIRGAQKMTDPPLMMPDEGFLNPPRMSPGAMNYYRAGTGERIEPLQTGGQPNLGMDLVSYLEARIREAFFVDQLQLSQGPQMTATEVLQRTEEKMRLMGPVVGRAQTELLSPLIIRSIYLLYRMGKFPEPPETMFDGDAKLKIVYTSPIAKAQEQVMANGIMRTVQLLQPFMAVDPAAMSVFNVANIARAAGDMYTLDPRFFKTEDELAAEAAARADAQAQAEAATMLKDQGIGLNNMAMAGKNMADTDLSGLDSLANMGMM